MFITISAQGSMPPTERVDAVVTTEMPQVGVEPAWASIVSTREVPFGQLIQIEVKPGQYLILEPFAVAV